MSSSGTPHSTNGPPRGTSSSPSRHNNPGESGGSSSMNDRYSSSSSGGGREFGNSCRGPPNHNNGPMDRSRPSRFDKDPPPYSSYNSGVGRGGWSNRGGRGGFNSQFKSSRPMGGRPFRSRSRSRSRSRERRDNTFQVNARNRFRGDRSRERSRDRLPQRHPLDSNRASSPVRGDGFRHGSPDRLSRHSDPQHDHSRRHSPPPQERHPSSPLPRQGGQSNTNKSDVAARTSPRPELIVSPPQSVEAGSSSTQLNNLPSARLPDQMQSPHRALADSTGSSQLKTGPPYSSPRVASPHSSSPKTTLNPPTSFSSPKQHHPPSSMAKQSSHLPLSPAPTSSPGHPPGRTSPLRQPPTSNAGAHSSPRPRSGDVSRQPTSLVGPHSPHQGLPGAGSSPHPAATSRHEIAPTTSSKRHASKRDDLSPLKPFLSRRGSFDLMQQAHRTSPKVAPSGGSSPSKPHAPPNQRRRSIDGEDKCIATSVRRKSIDEVIEAEASVARLEETILEPPKPKEAGDESSSFSIKQRPRLGWGQGLAAASSPNAGAATATTATTVKRPRMGWGMGLVVTQVPSPKAQSDQLPAVSTPPSAQVNLDKVVMPNATDGISPPEPKSAEEVQSALPVACQTPDPVDMEIDEEPIAVASVAVLEVPSQTKPKEQILSSIDQLDAEIADIQSKLTCAKKVIDAQLSLTNETSVSEAAPVDVSPSKKTRPVLVDPKLMAMVNSLMEENKLKATYAHALIEPLGKETVQYMRPVDCPGYENTLVRGRVLHDRMMLRVRKHKQAHYAEMKALATEYGVLKKAWRAKVKKLEKDRKKQEKRTKLRQKEWSTGRGGDDLDKSSSVDEKGHASSANDSQQINYLRSSSRLTNNSATQHTQMSMLKQIADVEKEKQAELWELEVKRKRLKNAMLSSGSSNSPYIIPDMIVDKELVKVKRFIPLPRPLLTGMEANDDGHLDGLHYLNAAQLMNPWSDIEKCIFIDKFLQTPKNFFRIASFLQNKTTGDVISFYYQTKKVLDYKAIIREQQLRRRGAGIKNTWNCWQLSLCAAMALGVKFPPAIQSSLLQQSKFRSHQAAQSILQAASISKDVTAKPDDEEANDSPIVLDLTDFLDDNLFTTGYKLTLRSVRSRFDEFRASADYHPDPPEIDKDSIDAATASPVASRRKPTTPRPVLVKGAAKKAKNNRPTTLKKADDEVPPLSSPGSSKESKDELQPIESPEVPQPLLIPLPMPVVNAPPLFAPSPVPLTPRTTPPPSMSSSLFLNSTTLSSLPPGKRVVQKWTEQEKSDFLKFFSVYGKDWAALTNSIPSKTAAQIKNYYQNYKNRLGLQDVLKKRPDRGPSSGSNTPLSHLQKSPTPSTNSPSHTAARPQPPSAFSFPISIQVPQEFPPAVPTSMNAAQHRLIQLQKELSRIQMQQLPTNTTTSMGGQNTPSIPNSAPGSQLKLLQYSLQQQVQMLQMQMYQQSVQESSNNSAMQGQHSFGIPRLNQPQYYERYKEESKAPMGSTDQQLLLAARAQGDQPPNLPPIEPPAAPVQSASSRMSFSSILNESLGSPQYSSSPSASTPIVIASAPTSISRSSMSSILNRQCESSPVTMHASQPKLPYNPPPPSHLRPPSTFSTTMYHPMHSHRHPLYHDPTTHSSSMQDGQMPIPSYHHPHHQPIQPVQQTMLHHSQLQPLQTSSSSASSMSIHQPIQPMPQSMLQPIQPMHSARHNVPIYSHRPMEDSWSNNPNLATMDQQQHPGSRYYDHSRLAMDKEAAHLREAQEEAAAAALNAAAAAARVEALQRSVVARQEQPVLHLAPPRYTSQLPPQPQFHLNLPRPHDPSIVTNIAASSTPSAGNGSNEQR
ncbi:hypothetical protein, variant 3 [Aphanomyces invadans]|uniref:SANT domain-containing protein n=1 Tax=Aphanomyces invadans TaxID=157072 RepID=A0A024UD31_9STRA|nr:hypothetical protein, variant 3 [Aphanomyces invadans]ETW03523.1 hypothetical protein, variant 3 [Aphanomyces invadans]|eukprot:XP_008867752.1 hypothetical protein, variant 3 [Aphanomyces invadans]